MSLELGTTRDTPRGESSAALDAAFAHCEEVTRRRARNFYYGLKLTPPPRRQAMYAVYAWMREADDLADAAGLGDAERRARIERLRERIEILFGRGARSGADRAPGASGAGFDDPVWLAMTHVVSKYRLSAEPFHEMLDGQLEDISHREYHSFEDLRGFCYRVASTVGLISIAIWGYEDPKARELAVDRGIAFQLTNILRDFREDLGRGRVYLPLEDFERHGLDAARLSRWEDPARCRAFVAEQAARVESFYRRSAALDEMITPNCRPTLWAMTTIYHGLLQKIVQDPARVAGTKRIRLSSLTKVIIAFRARRLAASAAEEHAPRTAMSVVESRPGAP